MSVYREKQFSRRLRISGLLDWLTGKEISDLQEESLANMSFGHKNIGHNFILVMNQSLMGLVLMAGCTSDEELRKAS